MIMEEHWKLVYVIGILALGFAVKSNADGSISCGFPAIYNFGDSNSDTGGISATLNEILPPNGETFFGHPAGRASDGRLIIDFIAEGIKLPYLSAYMDSIGTNFRHGANFATGGSSVRPPGFSPFNLGIQISQFIQFKARTTTLYNQLSLNRRIPLSISNLPRPAEFSQALYTFDIGQNDLGHGFQTMSEKQVRDSIPDIVGELSKAIHILYKEGARFFWIHNTGPLGCLPYNVIYGKKPGNVDKNGCVKAQNEAAMEFNKQLKNKITWFCRSI
uniref:Uncharacterized protein n=1 Tax=Gossypium raimondii TaxID=29730 RepID=A0A0D2QW95_GOSRA|nr:hypothetical protein B456_001G262100 [Gossypium raimondii]